MSRSSAAEGLSSYLSTHIHNSGPPLSLSYIYFLGPSNPASVLMLTKPYIHIYIYIPPQNYPLLLDEREKGPANVLSFIFGFLFSLFCICWMAAAAEASPPIFYSFLFFLLPVVVYFCIYTQNHFCPASFWNDNTIKGSQKSWTGGPQPQMERKKMSSL